MRYDWSNTAPKHSYLRVAEPLGRPVFTPEEARAPSRNDVLPHTANATETRFSLEVLAVDAPSRHTRRVTIFQLSSCRRYEKTGAASRFFSSHHKTGGTPLTREAKCGDGDGDARSWRPLTSSTSPCRKIAIRGARCLNANLSPGS